MTLSPTTEQVEPFFFGKHQLFGCYHEPPVWPTREQGVIICYPFGQEYIRSYRACHHLAARIARAGFPTLRFDYCGTGDSAGDDQDANLDRWQADLSVAVAELKARSGAEQIIVVGLRLGASLALTAAAKLSGLAGLVLWEPVVNGRQYLAELNKRHADTIMRFFAQPKGYTASERPHELLGFAVSEAMLNGLETLDLLQALVPRGKPMLLIDSHDDPAIIALQRHVEQTARSIHLKVPSFTVWVEDVDKGLVPQAVIEAITAWLERSFV